MGQTEQIILLGGPCLLHYFYNIIHESLNLEAACLKNQGTSCFCCCCCCFCCCCCCCCCCFWWCTAVAAGSFAASCAAAAAVAAVGGVAAAAAAAGGAAAPASAAVVVAAAAVAAVWQCVRTAFVAESLGGWQLCFSIESNIITKKQRD